MEWDWIVSPIVTAIIGAVTIILVNTQFKKEYKFNQEQHEIHGLVDAFNLLNTTRSRQSRRKVYELHTEYQENKNIRIFNGSAVEDVRADFDVLGKLVRTKNINKDHFLHEFGPLAYRCWVCLKDHIDQEREYREFIPFMENFEWLAEEAERYWRNKDVELSKTIIYDPDDP